MQQHMIQRLGPPTRRGNENRQILAARPLPDELSQPLRPQRRLRRILLPPRRGDRAVWGVWVGHDEFPGGAEEASKARGALPPWTPRQGTSPLDPSGGSGAGGGGVGAGAARGAGHSVAQKRDAVPSPARRPGAHAPPSRPGTN